MLVRALAPILVGVLAATSARASERLFVPTSIVCPAGQSGVLELTSTSDDDVRELLKVSFKDGAAVLVEIEAAEVGDAAFSPIFKEVPSAAAESDEAAITRNAAAWAARFLAEFCLEENPDVREQKWLELKAKQPFE